MGHGLQSRVACWVAIWASGSQIVAGTTIIDGLSRGFWSWVTGAASCVG